MKVVYPINKLEREKEFKLKDKHFYSYKSEIKDKYKLDDSFFLKMNHLSFEELLAIKFEDALNIYNGTIMLPLVEYYQQLVILSYQNLLTFYTKKDSSFKKKLMYSLFYNKHKFLVKKRNENIPI
jgi:hypothetical protein